MHVRDFYRRNQDRHSPLRQDPRVASLLQIVQPSHAHTQALNCLYFEGYIVPGSEVTFEAWRDMQSGSFLSFTFDGTEEGVNLGITLREDSKAAGRWQIELPAQSELVARRFEFQLRQRFQQLQGEVRINVQPAQLFSSELRGDQLSLSVMDSATHWTDFKGRLNGDRFEGEYRDASGAQGKFVARRVAQ